LKIHNVPKREEQEGGTRESYPLYQPGYIGTESWLDPTVQSSEVFPTDDYKIERRDRPNDPHGGVFIAVKNDLIAERVPELETECEILWCRISMAGRKILYVGGFYRNSERDMESTEKLRESLERLSGNNPLILAGDFNYPDWDWKRKIIKPGCGTT